MFLQLIPNQFLVDLANAGFRYVVDEINLVRNGPLIDLTGIHELLQVVLDIVQ